MSWKDWLYIPKGDKIAILVLSAIIVVLGITVATNKIVKQNGLTSIQLPADEKYAEWQEQLSKKQEEETKSYTEIKIAEKRNYQPKIKLGETIELNIADTSELKKIPGIGSVYANNIVKYRERLGGYVKMEQLIEVWGIDTYLYSEISLYLKLEEDFNLLYINTDTTERLFKHPYLNYKQASVIIDLRERKGKIKSIKRLELLDEFSRRDLERLGPYLSFE